MAISILAACQTEPATVERTSEVTATVTAIDLPGGWSRSGARKATSSPSRRTRT